MPDESEDETVWSASQKQVFTNRLWRSFAEGRSCRLVVDTQASSLHVTAKLEPSCNQEARTSRKYPWRGPDRSHGERVGYYRPELESGAEDVAVRRTVAPNGSSRRVNIRDRVWITGDYSDRRCNWVPQAVYQRLCGV